MMVEPELLYRPSQGEVQQSIGLLFERGLWLGFGALVLFGLGS
jgi:hypothetical protein